MWKFKYILIFLWTFILAFVQLDLIWLFSVACKFSDRPHGYIELYVELFELYFLWQNVLRVHIRHADDIGSFVESSRGLLLKNDLYNYSLFLTISFYSTLLFWDVYLQNCVKKKTEQRNIYFMKIQNLLVCLEHNKIQVRKFTLYKEGKFLYCTERVNLRSVYETEEICTLFGTCWYHALIFVSCVKINFRNFCTIQECVDLHTIETISV